MVVKAKKRTGNSSTRKRFENLTLEDEYIVRTLEGMPTGKIKKELERRMKDKALTKKAKPKRKKRRTSF